ncbi:hypothetical protein QFC19_002785 [Naganishia cerealis]|uniref:Uncharacterized protein n=1 Tax=Naganishia cerealis TaxID=610337 RepID=A0ACC2W5X0_9TREE|nr:hypothetical protein QFC19_002785 [Naganishia cerealis]
MDVKEEDDGSMVGLIAPRPPTLIVSAEPQEERTNIRPQSLTFPVPKPGDPIADAMSVLAIPRLQPGASTPGHHKAHGKHRKLVQGPSVKGTRELWVFSCQDQGGGLLIESHRHSHSQHHTPPAEVEVDITAGSHDVLIHTHSHPTSPPYSADPPQRSLGDRRSASTIGVNQQQGDQPHTVVEVYPPAAHTTPAPRIPYHAHRFPRTPVMRPSPSPAEPSVGLDRSTPPMRFGRPFGGPNSFVDIPPIPIIDYHSFMKDRDPHPSQKQHEHPLHEIPNPAPAPASGNSATEVIRPSPADVQDLPDSITHEVDDPNDYHRNNRGQRPSMSIANQVTAYRKVEPPADPADKNGQYALPPDYNARVEKDRLQREKEAERMQAKITAAAGGVPPLGMMPGPFGLGMGVARPPPLMGMVPGMGMGAPLMVGRMLGFRPPLMGLGAGLGGPLGQPMGGGLGMFNPNALPGRFGRDVLGRDFAGPGGLGESSARPEL